MLLKCAAPKRIFGDNKIMTQKESKVKAVIATVKVGHLEFEGLMLPDGTFGISLSQIVALNLVPPNRSLKQIQSLYSITFPSHRKVKSVLNSKEINFIGLQDFEKLLLKAAIKQNPLAIQLMENLVGLSLHQLFCDAFEQKFEKEDRQEYLKVRQEGKEIRREFTDYCQKYCDDNHKSDIYRKFIYSNCTDCLYKALFGRKASKLQEDWKCPKVRDAMTKRELRLVENVEDLAGRLIEEDNLEPLMAIKEAIARLKLPLIER
jgi:hypothetical protein